METPASKNRVRSQPKQKDKQQMTNHQDRIDGRPTKERSQCKACGTCCYDHTVLITFRDLREIHASYPDRRLEDLVVLYDAATEYTDRTILERFHPAVLMFEIPEESSDGFKEGKGETTGCKCHRSSNCCQDLPGSTWRGYLGLRYIKLPDGRTVCPQLDRTSGHCTIHAHKPLVCRTYPHVMDDAGQLARLEKVRCSEPWGNPPDLPPEEVQRIQKVVTRAYRVHDQFILEVQEWNKNPRDKTVGDFFAFALRPHVDEVG
ncbi:MAG: hypothetical protein RBG13Loki_2676 [Promethearchaeota archaeon CR_4]|nr:MAG: hypothetical protein RBG13Loki_2676 [Candidatus Lokiarchaeota archaeon CR_4]